MAEKLTAPCKDCPKRKLHCHSLCGDYRAYREYMEMVRELRMQRVEESDFIRAIKRKAANINTRRKLEGKRRR